MLFWRRIRIRAVEETDSHARYPPDQARRVDPECPQGARRRARRLSNIEELAASIREKGLLSPLTVRPLADGRFEILVGQRRYLACKLVPLDPVPCLVREGLSDADAISLSLIENVHRADMHPIDKAKALQALYAKHGSYEGVAKELAVCPNGPALSETPRTTGRPPKPDRHRRRPLRHQLSISAGIDFFRRGSRSRLQRDFRLHAARPGRNPQAL